MLVSFTLVCAIEKAEAASDKKVPEWAIFMYLCGSDLESGHGAATEDFNELTKVKLPSSIEYYIMTGGASKWVSEKISSDKIELFRYDSKGLEKIKSEPDENMGTGDSFSKFLSMVASTNAKHKAVIVWDHGAGSIGGVAYDDRYKTMIKLNDMRKAFADNFMANADNPPIDIIGFDTCLMSTIDVANSLYGYGRYMIASQETEPANGWGYEEISNLLKKNSNISPLELGKRICDCYYNTCKANFTDGLATISLIDLDKMPNLNKKFEKLIQEAVYNADNDDKYLIRLARRVNMTDNFGSNTAVSGYTDMIDIGSLVSENPKLFPNTGKEFLSSLYSAIVYNVNGEYRSTVKGLSVFYPLSNDSDRLEEYRSLNVASPALGELYDKIVTSDHSMDSYYFYSLSEWPVKVNKNGAVEINAPAHAMPYVDAVSCALVHIDTENDRIVVMGKDSYVTGNWETGYFVINHNGNWGSLDGHPLYVILDDTNAMYNLYRVPIKVNGNMRMMLVGYDRIKDENKILGVTTQLHGTKIAPDKITQLKPGDKITTVMYTAIPGTSIKEMKPIDCDTFTFTENSRVADAALPDGIYGYLFGFSTTTHQMAFSSAVLYKRENGKVFPCDIKGNPKEY